MDLGLSTLQLADMSHHEVSRVAEIIGLKLTKQTIAALQSNWIWVEGWDEGATVKDSAARIVTFDRTLAVLGPLAGTSVIHITADARYKLWVNGQRVAVGPSRSVPSVWYYDTIDLGPFLIAGENRIAVDVIRYFPSARAGLPFARSSTPGLTIVGAVGEVDLRTGHDGWQATVQNGIVFPTGLVDDVFLHVSLKSASWADTDG